MPVIEQSTVIGPIWTVDGVPAPGAEEAARRAAKTNAVVSGAPGSTSGLAEAGDARHAGGPLRPRVPGITELDGVDRYLLAVPFGRRADGPKNRPMGETFVQGAVADQLRATDLLAEPWLVTAGHSDAVGGLIMGAVEERFGLVCWWQLLAEGAVAAACRDRLALGHDGVSVGFDPIEERSGDWAVREVVKARIGHVALSLGHHQVAYREARAYTSLTALYEAVRAWQPQPLHPTAAAALKDTRAQQTRRQRINQVARGEITVQQALASI